ncbi:MAG: hypothetical protein ACRCXB_10330 [Aeromonadaceae bacterium]
MKVLVIYEAVPEQTYMAKVEMTSDMYDRLKVCHGYMVNNTDVINEAAEEAVTAISYAFSTEQKHIEWCETELDKELFMTMKDIAMTDDARDISGIDALIHCALLM